MRTLLLAALAAFLVTAPVAQAKNADGHHGKGVAARLLPESKHAKHHGHAGKKHAKHKGRHGKHAHHGKHARGK